MVGRQGIIRFGWAAPSAGHPATPRLRGTTTAPLTTPMRIAAPPCTGRLTTEPIIPARGLRLLSTARRSTRRRRTQHRLRIRLLNTRRLSTRPTKGVARSRPTNSNSLNV